MRISSFFAAIVFPAAAIAFRDNNVLEFNHGINDFVQDFPSFSAGGNPEPKICWNLPGGKSILDYADISGTSALDFQSMPASGNCPRKLPHSCKF